MFDRHMMYSTALKERTTRIKGDGSQMQRMQCARFVLKFQYLIKEFLQVTGPQFQTGHLIWICTIQMVKPLIVVFKCYVLLRKLKVVGQIQDVSADRVQFFFASLVLEREKEALGITKNICPYILHSTRVVDIGGFESQDGEDWNGGIYRCSAIYYSYYNSIPLAVVSNRHRREKTELCKPSHKISKFY